MCRTSLFCRLPRPLIARWKLLSRHFAKIASRKSSRIVSDSWMNQLDWNDAFCVCFIWDVVVRPVVLQKAMIRSTIHLLLLTLRHNFPVQQYINNNTPLRLVLWSIQTTTLASRPLQRARACKGACSYIYISVQVHFIASIYRWHHIHGIGAYTVHWCAIVEHCGMHWCVNYLVKLLAIWYE